MYVNNKNQDKVLTDTGQKNFAGIQEVEYPEFLHLKFHDGSEIKCSLNHPIITIDGTILATNLNKKTEITTKDGGTFLKSKRTIKRKQKLYDLIEVEGNHTYYTNNILSHNCDFLGSSNTLIGGAKLQQLASIVPISETEYMKIYEQPIQDNVYVCTVDVSGGNGGDYHVVTVIDVTHSPYKQVFLYRNNKLHPTKFASIVEQIATKYNKAILIVESNNDGKLVTNELWELEYENLLMTTIEKNEIIVSTSRGAQIGVATTKKTKRLGCTRLRELIEMDILVIQDFETISELSTFVTVGSSYEAESGRNDDIVMTLVIFSWFCTTQYFADLTGINTIANMRDRLEEDENNMSNLVGFVDDGTDEDDFDDFNMFSDFFTDSAKSKKDNTNTTLDFNNSSDFY